MEKSTKLNLLYTGGVSGTIIVPVVGGMEVLKPNIPEMVSAYLPVAVDTASKVVPYILEKFLG